MSFREWFAAVEGLMESLGLPVRRGKALTPADFEHLRSHMGPSLSVR